LYALISLALYDRRGITSRCLQPLSERSAEGTGLKKLRGLVGCRGLQGLGRHRLQRLEGLQGLVGWRGLLGLGGRRGLDATTYCKDAGAGWRLGSCRRLQELEEEGVDLEAAELHGLREGGDLRPLFRAVTCCCGALSLISL
jgi:hypothetical protein